MTPDDPRHGTYTGYQNHGCRCFPCRLARSQRVTSYATRTEPASVSAEPSRRHIEAWRASTGGGRIRFARLAGISESAVGKVISGKPSIHARTSRAILSVPLDSTIELRIDEVPSLSFRRRVQALAAIGWSFKRQSALLGYSPEWMTSALSSNAVKATTDRAIRGLYNRICMSRPPMTTKGERISAVRTMRYAAARGWAPPLAWDDIDDADEQPQIGTQTRTTWRREELLAEWAHFQGLGVPMHQAARQLGVTPEAIEMALYRDAKESA